jgi:hypothetical protein
VEDEEDLRRVAAGYVADYGSDAPGHLRADAVHARRAGDELSSEAWDNIADEAEVLLARVRH